jgi:SAM-dependent methyltransferase
MEPKKFRAFEHSGWEKIPASYHDAFGDLTTQAIAALLDAVGVRSGVRVLDIASGPGYVAAAAHRRGAVVAGIDFSAAMLAEARRLHRAIEFCQGDAEDLPFKESAFDAAVMNFGLLHLGRQEQALSEAQRMLRPGGRFAFTVWAKPEEARGFRIVLRAIEQYGDMNVNLPPGPPFFRFSEASECVAALLAAGFTSPQVSQVPQTWRLPSGDRLFEIMLHSTVRTAGLLRVQKPEALARIRDAVRQEAEVYRARDNVELPMPAVLATASTG